MPRADSISPQPSRVYAGRNTSTRKPTHDLLVRLMAIDGVHRGMRCGGGRAAGHGVGGRVGRGGRHGAGVE
jgi:hypothetical protein